MKKQKDFEFYLCSFQSSIWFASMHNGLFIIYGLKLTAMFKSPYEMMFPISGKKHFRFSNVSWLSF